MSYDSTLNLDATAMQGRIYGASTDALSLGTTGSLGRLRLALTNPTNSGRVVHIVGIVAVNATAVPGLIRQWRNPTVGVPTTVAAIPPTNLCLLPTPDTNLAAKSLVYADSSLSSLTAMSGGSQLPPLGCPAQSRQVYAPSPLVVMPGVTLGLDGTFGAVSITGNSLMSIYFYEVNQ